MSAPHPAFLALREIIQLEDPASREAALMTWGRDWTDIVSSGFSLPMSAVESYKGTADDLIGHFRDSTLRTLGTDTAQRFAKIESLPASALNDLRWVVSLCVIRPQPKSKPMEEPLATETVQV